MSTAEYVKAVASPSMTLISFEKCGTSYQSATPVYQQGSIEQCGLISFLALVQQLEVDLLPITWQPFLDRVGEGGTAEIRQSLINLQMSLAFKRIKDSELAMLDESIIFHRLMAEISVLGHASVRGHPNIVSLLGVCWQVIGNNVAWKAWPVLVFEKTPFGNLKEFAQSEMGQKLHPHDKVQLCGDIAMAIRDMNASSKCIQ
jgi:hypothetical protein